MKLTDSQQTAIKSGFLVLIGFAILRPLSLMGREDLAIGTMGITDILGVGISYLLILPLLAGLRQIKFDLLSLFMLAFVLYTIESLVWGSEIRRVAQTILPFVVFFSVRTFITQIKQARVLLIFLVLGFIIPISLSSYYIVLGKSIHVVEWHNQLPRFAGAFTGIHTLSYSMLFFSFLYCILNQLHPFRNSINRIIIGIFLLFSTYCLYKSLTRTAMVGFILFWFIYLWGINKREFFIALLLSVIVGIVFSGHIYSIIFKKDIIDFNTATSGRLTLIINNINLFFDSSFAQQLFGRGIGNEHLYAFHNDYIALLMQLGIIGLILYLVLLYFLIRDVFSCEDKKVRTLFAAILISVLVINFGSNAVIFRIELSQYFWAIMGLFYFLAQNVNREYDTRQS